MLVNFLLFHLHNFLEKEKRKCTYSSVFRYLRFILSLLAFLPYALYFILHNFQGEEGREQSSDLTPLVYPPSKPERNPPRK